MRAIDAIIRAFLSCPCPSSLSSSLRLCTPLCKPQTTTAAVLAVIIAVALAASDIERIIALGQQPLVRGEPSPAPLPANLPGDVNKLLAVANATRGEAWNRLALWVDSYGARLSGSTQLEKALDGALAMMTEAGFDNVHAEAATIPKWVRTAAVPCSPSSLSKASVFWCSQTRLTCVSRPTSDQAKTAVHDTPI